MIKDQEHRLHCEPLEMFWNDYRTKPTFADWVTGKLRIPRGELLEYVHMYYLSKFESDMYLQVNKGIILKDWEVKNY